MLVRTGLFLTIKKYAKPIPPAVAYLCLYIDMAYSVLLIILVKVIMLCMTIVTYCMAHISNANSKTRQLYEQSKTFLNKSNRCIDILKQIHLKYNKIEEQLDSTDMEIYNNHIAVLDKLDLFQDKVLKLETDHRTFFDNNLKSINELKVSVTADITSIETMQSEVSVLKQQLINLSNTLSEIRNSTLQ
jgi:hypothetical protein